MGRNILVVEDDRNICDLIHMYLVKEGFDVRIAGDGGKAIEEFQKQVPDLILLDIMACGPKAESRTPWPTAWAGTTWSGIPSAKATSRPW